MRYLLVIVLLSVVCLLAQNRQQQYSPKKKKFIENYLSKLETTDKEEFQRLNLLKEQNPKKFRREMREILANKLFLYSDSSIEGEGDLKLPLHFSRFMERIKEREPEEYQRLKELGKTNPAELKRQIHLKLKKNRRKVPFKHFLPYLKKLNEEDPERYKKLKELYINDPKSFRIEMTKAFLEKQQEGISKRRKIDKELKRLADLYMSLPDGVEKQQAYEHLRSSITLSVDGYLKEKRDMFDSLKIKLQKLEKHIQATERHRDQIIEQKLLKSINSVNKK